MLERRRETMLLFTAAAMVALCSCSRLRAPSDRGSLIFPHALHTEQAACDDCHGGVKQDRGDPAGKFIPGKAKCGECHEDELKSKCQMCHRGAKEGIRFARVSRKLSFSHAAHSGRVKQCETCHTKSARRARQGASLGVRGERANQTLVPKHDTCNTSGCHSRTYASLRCSKCHEDLQRYREKGIAQIEHGPGFVRGHGTLARQSAEACAQCHDQTYCAECHAGGTAPARASILFPEQVQRGFIHRGDYLSRHAVEAASSPQTCRKCHGQRHCRSCHALNGLAEAVQDKLPGGRTRGRHHPAGWMTPASASFHGQRARQDIGRCASCHDQGSKSNCVGCHRVGGLGGNPHPPGWSWRDKSSQCRNSSMCATCHVGGTGCR